MLLDLIQNIGVFLLLVLFFSVSIFVHELGHFLVARRCGLIVEVFAIGFGPAIWKTRRNGVTYKIGCIPLGGYVALPQLDPTGMSRIQGSGEDGAETEPVELPPISPLKKILVSLAGAAGNIVLAVVLAWIVYLVGMPAGPAERSAVVGYVDPAAEAHALGLRPGDKITRVNDAPVAKWSDYRLECALHEEVTLHAVAPNGAAKELSLQTSKGTLGEQMVQGVEAPDLCLVMSVMPGLSAEKAGLRRNDLITGFAGEKVYSRRHLVQLVNAHRDREVSITVSREVSDARQDVTSTVRPQFNEEAGTVLIGIQWNMAAVDYDTVIRPSPLEQLKSHASAMFRFFAALVTPQQAKSASAAVGGPVAIMASYWVIVKTSIMLAIWFTGFLNVNLAMLNLLPIPVLDGGHICFALYEAVARKPMHPRLVSALVNGFALLLIGLIIVLSIRDVDRFTPAGNYVRTLINGAETNAVPAAVTNAVPE